MFFRIFDWISEAVGWIHIVVSPLLIGLAAAAFIYFPNKSILTFTLAILVVLISLFLGIVWANRIWKKKGTIHFLSRVMATPELDEKEEDEKEEITPDKKAPTI